MGENKKKLSEQDICLRYITPALEDAGWDKMSQIRTEYSITDGRVVVRGNMSARNKKSILRADYLLSYKENLPVAIVEAKDNKHTIGDGIQQAIKYARMLKLPYAYSSNGDGFVEHNFITGEERTIHLNEFPTPEFLWSEYKRWNGIESEDQEEIVTEPFHFAKDGFNPRYYQRLAVNKVVEAVAKGRKRILLEMATGVGKTYTAFQCMWRLKQAGRVKKILFLADRNILVDQGRANEFAPFEGIMDKVQKKTMNSAFEIHFALYQQLIQNDGEDTFKQFKPNYFDMIVIDECHRGSANENSNWRRVLNYFDSAIHLGMTATPKETNDISNIEYFGDPIYSYSLKQGIQDGFLAPYKVVRVHLDKDLTGYRPEKGKRDVEGDLVDDRIYNTKDFDKNLVIDERTKVVAKKVTEYLQKNDPYMKTIIFCVDTEHAARMRQALVNENKDLVKENDKYVMRVTGNDPDGKAELDNFTDVNEKYPVIVTTSELLSTGVDTKMVKLIVIDKEIQSMIMFKQIVGRGTRIREQDGKMYFTLMDFRNVSRKFADPDFDGEPVQIKDVNPDDDMPDDDEDNGNSGTGEDDFGDDDYNDPDDPEDENSPKAKIYIDGVTITVMQERVEILDADGKLITESLRDYSKKKILEEFVSLDEFIKKWSETDKKQVIIEELEAHGLFVDALKDEVGREYDIFDLILHIAFDKPPLTRAERVNNVKKRGYLHKYSESAQKVLETLLDKYQDDDIIDFGSSRVLKLPELAQFGSSVSIKKSIFGGKQQFNKIIHEIEEQLHA